jgi:hypothetical protein
MVGIASPTKNAAHTFACAVHFLHGSAHFTAAPGTVLVSVPLGPRLGDNGEPSEALGAGWAYR